MKFSALAVLAAASLGSVSAEKTHEQIIRWCCVDSGFTCTDACDLYASFNDADLIAQDVPIFDPDEQFADDAPNFFNPLGDRVDNEEVRELCAAANPLDIGNGVDLHCCLGAYVCGDPHFQTWGGETFDYQGECDLMFMNAPKYAKGLGLEIHIRTKVRYDYSFIESAAIRIGDNVLEIAGYGLYKFNGVESATLSNMGEDIPVTYEMVDKNSHHFTIDAAKATDAKDAKLIVKTFKDWVSIHIEAAEGADFDESQGLLGSFPRGQRYGRDGFTVMADDNEFGQEWQVLPAEQGLFDTLRSPQMPEQCVLPKTTAAEVKRRLAESGVTEEDAKAACANVPSHQEFCVRDVLATGDLEMAQADAYVY